MGLSLEFCVRSIFPIPLEGFSQNFGHMFASVRQCAELVTQPCQHKVKVTGLSLEFRVRSVSPIPVEGFKLWSNVHLSAHMRDVQNELLIVL